jgi:flagellar biosynthesis/type III secretory pathway protein FliH
VTSTAVRVLKARQVSFVQDAADERDREEVLAQITRDAELSAAYADGYAAALTQTERDGTAAGPRIAAALELIAESAGLQHAEAVDVTSRAVLASAVDIAEWVLRHELSASGTSVLIRLGEAAEALLPSPTLRAHVSPQDEAAVLPWAKARGVEVHVDAELSPGDARFDNGTGSVDVTVSAALRIATQALGVDPAQAPR